MIGLLLILSMVWLMVGVYAITNHESENDVTLIMGIGSIFSMISVFMVM